MLSAFVIKAEELAALNYLRDDHPRPREIEWINRGTDQKLRPSSVDMLLRTLFQEVASHSVLRLRQAAGLRVSFQTERERDTFAKAFSNARTEDAAQSPHIISGLFDSRKMAEQAVAKLKKAGVPDSAISILWKLGQFTEPDLTWQEGHSKMSVAGAVAGGGFAGAMLGVIMLAIPGVGAIAATGAIATSAISSVAAISAAIGATGGAIARMLTDHDVDGVAAAYYEQQIKRGKIFVAVDSRIAKGLREIARTILAEMGGRSTVRHHSLPHASDCSEILRHLKLSETSLPH